MRTSPAFLIPALVCLTHPLQAAEPTRCLSAAEARVALTEGPEAAYFDRLQIPEMRAKTGLPLVGLSLSEARAAARAHYAAATLDFTPEEQAMLQGIVQRMLPGLRAISPFLASRTFSFIKVKDTVEGGLPHTRGAHIVLGQGILGSFLQAQRHGALVMLDRFAASLFIHEQAHVFERLDAPRFQALFTEVFGFRRLSATPDHPWLAERRVINPDGPDLGWAFPVQLKGKATWIRPDLILGDLEHPRMPQDFRMVAVVLEEKGGTLSMALDDQGHPQVLDLAEVTGYANAFPNADEFYHPHEIAADLLATLVCGVPPRENPGHPLRAKTAAWVKANLQN